MSSRGCLGSEGDNARAVNLLRMDSLGSSCVGPKNTEVDFAKQILKFSLFFLPSLIQRFAYSAILRAFGWKLRLFGFILVYSACFFVYSAAEYTKNFENRVGWIRSVLFGKFAYSAESSLIRRKLQTVSYEKRIWTECIRQETSLTSNALCFSRWIRSVRKRWVINDFINDFPLTDGKIINDFIKGGKH